KEGTISPSPQSSGSLSFEVGPADPGQLKQILQTYSEQLRTTDWRRERTAVYAIASVDNPMILPELSKLIELGHSARAQESLVRFKGNQEAEEMVKSEIRSNKAPRQLMALEILSRWKLNLTDEELIAVVHSPETDVRIKALRYIAK